MIILGRLIFYLWTHSQHIKVSVACEEVRCGGIYLGAVESNQKHGISNSFCLQESKEISAQSFW